MIIPLHKTAEPQNPLNVLEDILEAAGYEFDRVSISRLQFTCSGKQGDYQMVLEWNDDMQVIKSSMIINSTQNIDRDQLMRSIEALNETSWHGFFIVDGVGNSIFKSLVNVEGKADDMSVFSIEDMIDKAVIEADRLCITLALSDSETHFDLFGQDEPNVENLELLFSDTKGNA